MKNWLKKLFQKKEVNKQTAAIKLILWLIFIVILLIILKISSMFVK